MSIFSRLFSHATDVSDDLSQGQREAIVDLLHFCMCADRRLLPVESGVIAKEVAAFNWKSHVAFEEFARQSLAKAEAAMATPESRRTLLEKIGEQLVSTEVQTRAIALCPRIFTADGEFVRVEHEIFAEIKRAFGWPE
jgi:uncharacterized tellurite resistance protein B-like protein